MKEHSRSRRYYESIDVARMFMMSCIILADFGLPGGVTSLVTPVLNFAAGAMFMMYGYLVLRHDWDVRANIRRTGIALVICIVCYAAFSAAFNCVVNGDALGFLNVRGVMDFLMFNYWDQQPGASIWMLAAAFYALVVLYIIRRFRKLEVTICVICFAVAFVTGELLPIIGFDIRVGAFITVAIPYMIMGHRMHHKKHKVMRIPGASVAAIFAVGLLMSLAEYWALGYLDIELTHCHLLGFIPMAWAVSAWAVQKPHRGRKDNAMSRVGPSLYRVMYFIYNPVGVVIATAFLMNPDSGSVTNAGILTLGICLGLPSMILFILDGNIQRGIERQIKKNKRPI